MFLRLLAFLCVFVVPHILIRQHRIRAVLGLERRGFG
jgi:hypothetical protein